MVMDGRQYQLVGRWNDNGFWTLDILTATAEPILLGRKVELGMDLIGRYTDDRLPSGKLFVVSTTKGRTPQFNDMRENARLIYVRPV